MNKTTFYAGALGALLALPTVAGAQTASEPVILKGNLIDWYYYGKDIHSSAIDWFQQSPGGGAWIDENGVAHSTGAANYGLLGLTLQPGNTAKPLLPEFLIRSTVLYGNCGGVYVGNNTYYSFFGHEADYEGSMEGEYGSEEYEILVRKWTWDLDAEGNYINVKYETVGKMYNQATDLCYDPLYDKVYGVFNTGSGAYKLGELDMETFRITYISREAMSFYGELRCLAINSEGQLYGIDASGNVSRVSKTDGTLTYIGNVGFQSQHRMMSATFDTRTDRLYWIGYMNNGKASAATDGTNNTLSIADGGRDTGVYEVNTETGEATLIGKTDFVDVVMEYDENGQITGATTNKYGKMQLTGIYVEGSIIRKEVDQCISLTSSPLQLHLGETGTIEAKVKNIGTQTVRGRDYKVNFYVGGVLTATIDNDGDDIYTADLKVGESASYSFSYTASQTGQVPVYVEVVNSKDLEPRNNRTDEQTVWVLSDKVLPVVDLQGEARDGGISLTWADPQGHIVDGAEDYAPFSYQSLGAWTLVDGDKGYTQRPNNFNESISYANWSTPKAYIVFDPVRAGFDLAVGGERFMPYAGNQYFAAFYTAVPDDSEAGGHQVPNNDWMISPELSGEAQTVSFYARGYKGTEAPGYETEANFHEKMRVLYSAAGTDTTTFVVAADTFEVANTGWTRYEAQLPQGARHFALQCVSDSGFVLMIDDVDFRIKALEVRGYKVYRNGELVQELPATQLSFVDANAREDDVYTVVAVYAEGESNPSNKVSLGASSAIDRVSTVAAAGTTQLYNLRGQQVSSLSRPGLYIVRDGNSVRKIIVK